MAPNDDELIGRCWAAATLDTSTPDTVSLATNQLTVEHLAGAMNAVAGLLSKTAQFSGQAITATLENASRETLPDSWKQYLGSQLASLGQVKNGGVVMRPIAPR